MPRLSVLLLALLAAGCDGFSGGDQRLFEDAAFLGTSDGVTGDDWRVGPVFGGRVQVIRPATPNPARPNDSVIVQIYADAAPAGFALYRRRADGTLDLIQETFGVAAPNIYTFDFFGSEASPTGTSGSSRILILDGTERVATYGDVVLE